MINDARRRALRRSVWVASVLLIMAAPFAFLGWVNGRPLDVHRADVAMIQIRPVPEGPGSYSFSRSGQKGTRPLSEIEAFISDPLPHSVWQGLGCQGGGDLTVALTDGRTITYGPCRYPRSIYLLWAHIIDLEDHGSCRPNCGPGGSPAP
jgi:hypothetical protein